MNLAQDVAIPASSIQDVVVTFPNALTGGTQARQARFRCRNNNGALTIDASALEATAIAGANITAIGASVVSGKARFTATLAAGDAVYGAFSRIPQGRTA